MIAQNTPPATPSRSTKRRKICFYNFTGSVSGAERVLFSILKTINRETTDATVLAPESEQFRSVCSQRGLNFRPVPLLRARYTVRPDILAKYLYSALVTIWHLRRLFKEEAADLIHANTARSGIIATLATVGMKVKVLWHIHDMLPTHPLSGFVRILALLSKRVRLVAVSRATARSFAGVMKRFFDGEKAIHVVHNGIDTSVFKPASAASIEAFLASAEVSASKFRIGIVGQITPRKGQLSLIRSMAPALRTDLSNAVLIIVGGPIFNDDHEYMAELQQEACRLGVQEQIRFTGPRDSSLAMPALNVLVLNSKVEPFGLVVVEAMASGTPVVAAAVDGVPEIIEDGKSGLLFTWGDTETLMRHLLLIATDPDRTRDLIAHGLHRARTMFDETISNSHISGIHAALNN